MKTLTPRRMWAAVLGSGVLCAAGPGQSQELDIPTAIAVRRDAYREIGAAFKNLNDELKKPKPMVVTVKFNSNTIVKNARRMPNWFPAGSGPQSGLKTAAKAEIWTKRAEFDAIERKLLADATQMDKLAAAGDLKGVAAQARLVGGSCKSCHDRFRTKED